MQTKCTPLHSQLQVRHDAVLLERRPSEETFLQKTGGENRAAAVRKHQERKQQGNNADFRSVLLKSLLFLSSSPKSVKSHRYT